MFLRLGLTSGRVPEGPIPNTCQPDLYLYVVLQILAIRVDNYSAYMTEIILIIEENLQTQGRLLEK